MSKKWFKHHTKQTIIYKTIVKKHFTYPRNIDTPVRFQMPFQRERTISVWCGQLSHCYPAQGSSVYHHHPAQSSEGTKCKGGFQFFFRTLHQRLNAEPNFPIMIFPVSFATRTTPSKHCSCRPGTWKRSIGWDLLT